MTEAEWLEAGDPLAMLRFLDKRLSDRKFRLFACACCRRFWHMLSCPPAQPAVEAAERYADGLISGRQLADIACDRWSEIEPIAGISADKVLRAVQAAAAVSRGYRAAIWESFGYIQQVDEDQRAQANLLRDLAGNPYRTPHLQPACLTWNDSTVVRIAQAIYDDRAFNHLPILADALEDAGCDDAVLLAHCRGAGPHVRGCWAVDLLLGKE